MRPPVLPFRHVFREAAGFDAGEQLGGGVAPDHVEPGTVILAEPLFQAVELAALRMEAALARGAIHAVEQALRLATASTDRSQVACRIGLFPTHAVQVFDAYRRIVDEIDPRSRAVQLDVRQVDEWYGGDVGGVLARVEESLSTGVDRLADPLQALQTVLERTGRAGPESAIGLDRGVIGERQGVEHAFRVASRVRATAYRVAHVDTAHQDALETPAVSEPGGRMSHGRTLAGDIHFRAARRSVPRMQLSQVQARATPLLSQLRGEVERADERDVRPQQSLPADFVHSRFRIDGHHDIGFQAQTLQLAAETGRREQKERFAMSENPVHGLVERRTAAEDHRRASRADAVQPARRIRVLARVHHLLEDEVLPENLDGMVVCQFSERGSHALQDRHVDTRVIVHAAERLHQRYAAAVQIAARLARPQGALPVGLAAEGDLPVARRRERGYQRVNLVTLDHEPSRTLAECLLCQVFEQQPRIATDDDEKRVLGAEIAGEQSCEDRRRGCRLEQLSMELGQVALAEPALLEADGGGFGVHSIEHPTNLPVPAVRRWREATVADHHRHLSCSSPE